MNIILLLAMLQGVAVDIKPAPVFRVVSESALVHPKKSKYFEKTKVRILAMKKPYRLESKSKRYYISLNFYWYFRDFYFNDVRIPLSTDEELELRVLLIEKDVILKEKQRQKILEKL